MSTNVFDTNPYGSDFILSDTGDLVLTGEGTQTEQDIMTTLQFEKKTPVRFDGYITLVEALYCMLMTVKGDFPFEEDFGSNLPLYISKNIDQKFDEIQTSLEEELFKDDRIKDVNSIDIVKYPKSNQVIVKISVTGVNENEPSAFTFPFYLIN